MVCRDKENFFGRGWRRHKIHAEMHWALFPQNLTKTAYKLEECQLLDSGVLCYRETMLQYGYWGSNRAGPTQLWSHCKACSAFLQGRLSRMMDSSSNISHSNTCIISFYCDHLLLLKLSKWKTALTAYLTAVFAITSPNGRYDCTLILTTLAHVSTFTWVRNSGKLWYKNAVRFMHPCSIVIMIQQLYFSKLVLKPQWMMCILVDNRKKKA